MQLGALDVLMDNRGHILIVDDEPEFAPCCGGASKGKVLPFPRRRTAWKRACASSKKPCH